MLPILKWWKLHVNMLCHVPSSKQVMARWQDSSEWNKTLLCQKVLKEYNNCNEAMVAKRVAPIADQVHEDISVCPSTAQRTTISDRDTTSLPVNTMANYKIMPTKNAIRDVTTVLSLPHWIKHRPVCFCMLFKWNESV